MKFIYACDIHGDMNKYEKLYKIAIEKNIKNIVIGGDLLPKKADRRLPIQLEFIKCEFREYFKRLEKDNIKFISILGNDDLEIAELEYKKMISEFENVIDIDEKKYDIEDVSFIGLSRVLDTPFMRKERIVVEEGQKMPVQLCEKIYINKCQEIVSVQEWEKLRKNSVPKMEDVLHNLPKFTEGKKGIFVFHDPPSGLGLDCCKSGDKVGSNAIANYISKTNPYMTLHGHIHESHQISGLWKNKIGNTICINPGQTEFGEEELYYVLIDTIENRIKRETL